MGILEMIGQIIVVIGVFAFALIALKNGHIDGGDDEDDGGNDGE